MTEFISTMPLLVLFNIAWIISLAIALIIKKELKIPCLLISIISSLMIINFSTIDIKCVACTGADITISNMGVYYIQELLLMHTLFFIPLEIVLVLFIGLTGGFASLQEGLKGQG